jgi:hypothetical protein
MLPRCIFQLRLLFNDDFYATTSPLSYAPPVYHDLFGKIVYGKRKCSICHLLAWISFVLTHVLLDDLIDHSRHCLYSPSSIIGASSFLLFGSYVEVPSVGPTAQCQENQMELNHGNGDSPLRSFRVINKSREFLCSRRRTQFDSLAFGMFVEILVT